MPGRIELVKLFDACGDNKAVKDQLISLIEEGKLAVYDQLDEVVHGGSVFHCDDEEEFYVNPDALRTFFGKTDGYDELRTALEEGDIL